jgi:hypothetical protein
LDSSSAVQEVTGSSKVINGDSKGSKSRQKKVRMECTVFGTNLTSIQINFSQETTVNGKSPPRKREGSKEDKQRAEKPKHREVQKLSKEDSKQPSPKKSKEGASTK